MKGHNTLWLPGVDHAGIATQVVVEKKLFNETGKTRHDLGRDEFLKKVWEWKETYGSTIDNQHRRLGASLDWSRAVFTMDEPRSKAVTEAFVRMYEKGLIYRDTRLVNWDCTLHTAISNIEVDHIELDKPKKMTVPGHGDKKYDFGMIWSFAYKVEGMEGDDEIIVSTTRPETMLGDTAVAVHPDDERYKKFHGKHVIHPFNGRRLPIICDSVLVKMEFGTGAVKITPAHDPNDFEVGRRHNLEFINILNDDGILNENAEPFTGMKRFDARVAVLKAMEEKGIFKGAEPNKMSIGICSRSKDVIEPMIKPQWFVRTETLAEKALEAVRDGSLKIYPERETKTWEMWLTNNQPWCISRQLWWGHRVPAYFATIEGSESSDHSDESKWFVARSEDEAREKAAKKFGVDPSTIKLEQDEDVLDTWFSSGLFPFSTLGWPDETADMKAFYPGTLLETGLDIIFFWVARMVFMGIALTDQLPFKEVLLHAMVRDKFGEKMSKSSGNVIDPIEVIEGISLEDLHKKLDSGNLNKNQIDKAIKGQKEQFPDGIPECGTDAMRFTLLNYMSHGRDINMDIMRVFSYRTFCNKLWNATKFCLMNLSDFSLSSDTELPAYDALAFGDKWILSRLERTIVECDTSFREYDFNRYTEALYNFFLRELCDVYLEWIKPTMNADLTVEDNAKRRQRTQHTLYTCLEQGLRLLHPAMPFLTEELWQRLPLRELVPHERRSIMINPYPQPVAEWGNSQIESEMTLVMNVISKIRAIKGVYTLTNRQRPEVYVRTSIAQNAEVVRRQMLDIANLAFSGDIKVISTEDPVPEGCGVEIIDDSTEVHVLLKGMIDFGAEVKKLTKQRDKLEKVTEGLVKRMQMPNYMDKVPENVRADNEVKLEHFRGELDKLAQAIEELSKLTTAED